MMTNQIRTSQEAFFAKDYVRSISLLLEVYDEWSKQKEVPLKKELNSALEIIEQIVELPEIEVTDYIVGILSEERVLLERNFPPPDTRASIDRLKNLVYDLQVIITYFEEYLGVMNETKTPSISVGIEALGKYCFYENIYESEVNEMAKGFNRAGS